MPGVGLMVWVVGLGSYDPEFKSLGGQLCYVVSPAKVVAVGEVEKFKRLNLFQWMTK